MSAFVTQQLFNMCALAVAQVAATSGEPVESLSAKLAAPYQRDFQDERLPEDIAAAAKAITTFFTSAFPPEALASALIQMQFCVKHYRPDGTKRPFKLLGGTWFNKESAPLPDKVKQCFTEIAAYHLRVVGGSIPAAPKGWSL